MYSKVPWDYFVVIGCYINKIQLNLIYIWKFFFFFNSNCTDVIKDQDVYVLNQEFKLHMRAGLQSDCKWKTFHKEKHISECKTFYFLFVYFVAIAEYEITWNQLGYMYWNIYVPVFYRDVVSYHDSTRLSRSHRPRMEKVGHPIPAY